MSTSIVTISVTIFTTSCHDSVIVLLNALCLMVSVWVVDWECANPGADPGGSRWAKMTTRKQKWFTNRLIWSVSCSFLKARSFSSSSYIGRPTDKYINILNEKICFFTLIFYSFGDQIPEHRSRSELKSMQNYNCHTS